MAKKIDWFEYLTSKLLGEESKFPDDEIFGAANDWTLCACGAQEKVLRGQGEEPWDSELSNLGAEFAVEIKNENWAKSLAILLRIQRRAGFLLHKLHLSNNPKLARALKTVDSYTGTETEKGKLVSKFYAKVGGSHVNA